MTVEQYLSLQQDSLATTPDDAVSLPRITGVTVTVTDGDGDKASALIDVSAQISFHDDGPRCFGGVVGRDGGAGRGQYQYRLAADQHAGDDQHRGDRQGRRSGCCGHWLYFAAR